MKNGKFICNTLKQIRLDIARSNGIEYAPRECHFRGDCSGTCPACESEMRYLEREISRKRRLGKAALVAGVSLGLMSFTATSCHTVEKSVQEITTLGAMTQVSGTVLDDNNEPVIGATVLQQSNPKNGVATDFNGRFTLNVPAGAMILFTYVGYEDVVVQAKDGMTVNLKPNGELLGEVVVVSHDKIAEYPGGDEALRKFIKKNLVFPKDFSGREIVRIDMDVDMDGNVSNPRVPYSETGSPFEREALRVASLVQKVKPARNAYGKPIDSIFTMEFDSLLWTDDR